MSAEALLNALGADGRMIAYRPEWRPLVGSVNAVILLGQLLYWWRKNHKRPFYKFRDACEHQKYRDGDSWCEELGFSKFEFDKAWKAIEKAGFASKRTDMERVTFYSVDESVLGKSIMLIYGENQQDSGGDSGKSSLLIYESKETEPGKSTNLTYENKESEFTLYKEHRLPTETTTEINPPSQSPPSDDSGGVVTGGDAGGWVLPEALSEADAAHVSRLLEGLTLTDGQLVLDSLAWKILQGEVQQSRVGLLNWLAGRMREGVFDREPAQRWRELQKREQRPVIRQMAAELQGLQALVQRSGDSAGELHKQLEGMVQRWRVVTGSEWGGSYA